MAELAPSLERLRTSSDLRFSEGTWSEEMGDQSISTTNRVVPLHWSRYGDGFRVNLGGVVACHYHSSVQYSPAVVTLFRSDLLKARPAAMITPRTAGGVHIIIFTVAPTSLDA